MSYNIFDFIAGSTCRIPQKINSQSEESHNLSDYFSISDFAVTIMLKGARKYRTLEGKVTEQYKIICDIIDKIINNYSKQHWFAIEYHKCGLWIHSHGVVQMKHRSKTPILKKEIYLSIENKPLYRGGTYKHRIHMEKMYSVLNWENYIKKFQPIKCFPYKYKLFSNPKYICLADESPVENQDVKSPLKLKMLNID